MFCNTFRPFLAVFKFFFQNKVFFCLTWLELCGSRTLACLYIGIMKFLSSVGFMGSLHFLTDFFLFFISLVGISYFC